MNQQRHVFLVRHGEAKQKNEDPWCGLTNAGEAAIQKLANWLGAAGIRIHEIHHSGKRRAEQTAAILASALDPPVEPRETSGLKPNDDVRPIADLINRGEHNIMIVGHLPFLGRLVGQCTTGDPEASVVGFDTGTLVCLARSDGRWTVERAVSPSLLE